MPIIDTDTLTIAYDDHGKATAPVLLLLQGWPDDAKQTRTLAVPTIYIHGADDGVNPPATAKEVADKFTGRFEQIELPSVGHFVQRETAHAVGCLLAAHFSA